MLFKSILVRGKKMRRKHSSYKMAHRVGSCDLLREIKLRWERTANGYPADCEVHSTSQKGGFDVALFPMLSSLEN